MSSIYEMLNSKETVVIGSGEKSDVVFNDPQISPCHCQISKVKNGGYLIVDLDSASGTYINNTRIAKAFATDSDSIKIGNYVFQISGKIDEQAIRVNQQTSTGVAPIPGTNPQNNNTSNLFNEPTKYPDNQQSLRGGSKQNNKIIVYFLAAPEDENICKAIYKHLSTTRFSSPLPIEMIGDFKISAGEEISVYQAQLSEADIVLAFVSVDFLSNNGCYERLKTVIANHNNRKTILLPILARNCMWKATPFATLPLLPKNHQPLNNRQFWNSEDDALTNVVDDVYKSINDFTRNSTVETPVQQTVTTPELKVNWRGKYLWKVLWKRFAAYILDVIIIMIPIMVIQFLIWGDNFLAELQQASVSFYLIYYGLLMVVWSLFDSSRWRGTPGKHIMKLQITDDTGRPISFGKAFVRNLIKFSLFALVAVDESGITGMVFYLAQIISFIIFKKFIHDHLSHTVIGERLKEETYSPLEAGPSVDNSYNKPNPEFTENRFTGQPKTSPPNKKIILAVCITVAICIAAFFLREGLSGAKNNNGTSDVNTYDTSSTTSTGQNLLNESTATEKVNQQSDNDGSLADNSNDSYYKNAVLTFCAKIDANGLGYDFGNDFIHESFPDEIFFVLDNRGNAFSASEVKFNLYKKEYGEYKFQNTLPVKINPDWASFIQRIIMNEPGEYRVDAYTDQDEYITSGSFTFQ